MNKPKVAFKMALCPFLILKLLLAYFFLTLDGLNLDSIMFSSLSVPVVALMQSS